MDETTKLIISATPFCGPRPGSNSWADLAFEDRNGKEIFYGEDVDRLARAGLLRAVELPEPAKTLQHPEGYEIEATHRYFAA